MAGTEWGSYNLPAIWSMIKDEDACTGADRVLAWDGLADTVREQHRRLIKAGADLAAVWSPEANASAATFLGVLDGLADSMWETLTKAEDTRSGLNGVVAALGQAQTTMRTLAEGRAEVSTDWVPRFIDGAEDEYDEKAQQVMRNAEAAIADYSTLMDPPSPYEMKGRDGGGGTSIPIGGDGGSGSGSGIRATPVAVPVPHDPVLPDPDGGPGTGIELSGVTAASVAGSPAVSATIGSPAVAGGGSGVAGLIPGGLGVGAGVGAVGGFGVRGGRGAAAGGRQAVPVRRGLPPGAVIGEGGLGRSPSPALTGSPGGGRGRRRDRADSTVGGEADERWQAFEGVDPVIEADTRVVRHDPGPGVLGFGR